LDPAFARRPSLHISEELDHSEDNSNLRNILQLWNCHNIKTNKIVTQSAVMNKYKHIKT